MIPQCKHFYIAAIRLATKLTRRAIHRKINKSVLLPRIGKLGGRFLAPQTTLLAVAHVGGPHFDGVLRLPSCNERRVPQLRRNAQIFAAAHQRVRLGALFGCGARHAVAHTLLAHTLGHEPSITVCINTSSSSFPSHT